MRIRLMIGLDVRRDRAPERHDVQREPEHAPEVDVKGSHILDRATAPDFDPEHRIGFLRNPTQVR